MLRNSDKLYYSGIYNYFHTFVPSTFQFAHTLLHKLEVCTTAQSGGLGLTCQKCAYTFDFTITYKEYREWING